MKISSIALNKTDKNKETSFGNLRHMYNNDLEKVYRITAPPYDKNKYALILEVCGIKQEALRDNKGKVVVNYNNEPVLTNNFHVDDEIGTVLITDSYQELRDYGFTDYYKNTPISDPQESPYMGYRFRMVDKLEANKIAQKIAQEGYDEYSDDSPYDKLETKGYVYDEGERTMDAKFTVLCNNMGIKPKSGPALHVLYDSFDWSNEIKPNQFMRNHFNKAGGDLDSLLKFKSELEPYRYIMTNPYIGTDSKSSHKYWPEKLFHVPSVDKFKKVIVELYKDGKGYIADGAFTSQSIQSPLFQHVLKYGKESPFYNWFKINGRLELGIFPDFDKFSYKNKNHPVAMDHIGYKVINALNDPNYDKHKPSYIQFFDDRLASEEQQNDTKNLIQNYAKPNPEGKGQDAFDITLHQESIVPYYFELDYKNDDNAYKRFSDPGKKMLKNIKNLKSYFSFNNYSLVRKSEAKGAEFWDGNTDIIKLNLSNPQTTKEQGLLDAREMLTDVATHWTKFANDSLLEYLAKTIQSGNEEEIKRIAKENDIDESEWEAIKQITSSEESGSHPSATTVKGALEEHLKDFRYETLPVSNSLYSTFASPDFREAMADPRVQDKMFSFILQIIKGIDAISKEKLIEPSTAIYDTKKADAKDKIAYEETIMLTKHGKYLFDLIAPKLIGYCVMDSLFPPSNNTKAGGANKDDKRNVYINKEGILSTRNGVEEKSIHELGVSSSADPKIVAQRIANHIARGINPADDNRELDAADDIARTGILKCDYKSFKQAEALLKKTGGGLNWRFDAAKDVADLTATKNGIRNFEKAWDDVIEFWGEFIKNVHAINPSSYIIAEVTDLWSFYNLADYYEPRARKYIAEERGIDEDNVSASDVKDRALAIRKEEWGKYAGNNSADGDDPLAGPNVADRMLYEKTAATTGSNYSVFFNIFPEFISRNFEFGNYNKDAYANMGNIVNNLEKFLTMGPPLYVSHSHMFIDNHDKPRAIHCLAVDMGVFLSRFGCAGKAGSDRWDDDDVKRAKEACYRVTGERPQSYDFYSSKAIAVGDLFLHNFEKVLKDQPEKLKIVKQAVRDLAIGKFKTKIDRDFTRAEAFGNTDFTISLNKVMEQAEYIAKNEGKEWFSDEEAKAVKDETFDEVVGPASQKLNKMTEVVSAVTGIPFTYAGDNMGHAGYEYATKNITQQNRNLVRHDWLDKNSEEFKPEVRENFNTNQSIQGVYKLPGMSAIAGGTPVCLPQNDPDNIGAIMKYNDKGSVVVEVLSSVGMGKDADPFAYINDKEVAKVPYISLKGKDGHIYAIQDKDGASVPLRRKVYDSKEKRYVDEVDLDGRPVEYDTDNGTITRADGSEIELKDTVSYFYKPKATPSHERIMSYRYSGMR